jgi:hypothetical protein
MMMKRSPLRVMPVDISEQPSVSFSARKELIPTRCHWAICGSTQSGKQHAAPKNGSDVFAFQGKRVLIAICA